MMRVGDVMDLSLGEWAALCRFWDKAHGKSTVRPPTEDEFEAAVLAARGVPAS